jgi:solute carrier family 25 phosphate transporter 23/24/25/41
MVDGETQNNREDAYATGTADTRSAVDGDSSTNTPSRREIYEATLSGAWDYGQRLPLLRSDPRNRYRRLAHSLEEFRAQEGEKREKRLREVWWRLPKCENAGDWRGEDKGAWRGGDGLLFTRERANELKEMYESELIGRCRGSPPGGGSGECGTRGSVSQISWTEFCEYAEAKEVGAWLFDAFAMVLRISDRRWRFRKSCGIFFIMSWI